MKDLLFNFLERFPNIDKGDIAAISESLIVESFEKETLLLKAGMIPRKCYFVLKGCVRQYQIINGVEKTTEFFTEKNGAVTSHCYLNQIPSEHFLSCMEDSILLIGDPIQDQKMYEKFPVLESITRSVMEQEWGKSQESLIFFKTSSPEERYLDLVKNRPELLQRAPQHQIASYLGVTPESLSRIRKRVAKT